MIVFVGLLLLTFCSTSLKAEDTVKGCASLLVRCKGNDAISAVIRGPIAAELSKHTNLNEMHYSCELEHEVEEALRTKRYTSAGRYIANKIGGRNPYYFEYTGDDADDLFRKAVEKWVGDKKIDLLTWIPLRELFHFGCSGNLRGKGSKVACVFATSYTIDLYHLF